jgi:hypothetical protein
MALAKKQKKQIKEIPAEFKNFKGNVRSELYQVSFRR